MRLFDLHCDTATVCFDNRQSIHNNRFSLDINRLKGFERSVQTFAVFTDGSQDKKYVFDVIDFVNKSENQSFKIIKKSTDLQKDISVFGIISIENAAFVGDDLSIIDQLAEFGVKMLSLTWNGKNLFASGKDDIGGLTELGKKIVKRCEEKGIFIDVSHLNDQSFSDLCKIVQKPLIASHSNCRAVCNNKRNLTDAQIKSIVSMGGLIGLNLYPKFINDSSELELEDIILHIEHFLDLGAQKSLALGCDFDGCKMDKKLQSVCDLKSLYTFIKIRFGQKIADDIFYNNANQFFIKME